LEKGTTLPSGEAKYAKFNQYINEIKASKVYDETKLKEAKTRHNDMV
jgi:hypothetical protein